VVACDFLKQASKKAALATSRYLEEEEKKLY